jgi:2-oxoglutarate dehydrogenase E2 component (dihydrolipoamide succinyltransferase)
VSTVPYPPATPSGDDEVLEFSRARRSTAEHMVRSLATSAHTLVATEVDYHGVDGVRRRAGLSYLPFVARAVVDAIADFPHVNASVGDDALIVHRHVHLGVAVDVDFQALVVPVVANAETKRLRALGEEVAALADMARSKRLGADNLTGGTFTITNVGAYGTLVTAPVINQPQVAILSTDGVKMQPVALRAPNGEWTIGVHPVGNLCLSFDHRAVDGAYASAFLARVRDILEQRDWEQEV